MGPWKRSRFVVNRAPSAWTLADTCVLRTPDSRACHALPQALRHLAPCPYCAVFCVHSPLFSMLRLGAPLQANPSDSTATVSGQTGFLCDPVCAPRIVPNKMCLYARRRLWMPYCGLCGATRNCVHTLVGLMAPGAIGRFWRPRS